MPLLATIGALALKNWKPLTEGALVALDLAKNLTKKSKELSNEFKNPEQMDNQTADLQLQIEKLQAEIERLSQNEVEQAELINKMAEQSKDISNNMYLLRNMAIVALLFGIGALALVVVLHFF